MPRRKVMRGGLRRYADGGTVGMDKRNTMIPAPQSQKVPETDSRGVGGSKGWYENYGKGPEHLFLGDRRLPTPQLAPRDTLAPPPAGRRGNSLGDLVPLLGMGAVIGKDLWDWYKERGIDPSQLGAENLVDPYGYPIDISGTNDRIQGDFDSMEMPTAEFDPSLWDRTKQGAGGALDMYIGTQQGGATGLGQTLEGGSDLYQSLLGESNVAKNAGQVGSLISNLGDGTVQGYLQAGGDAVELAKAMGYTGPVVDSVGNLLPIVGQLFSAYEGIRQGNPAGYAQAAGSLYGAASTAGLTSSTGALASSGLGVAAPLAAAGFAIADASNYALGHNDRRNSLYASNMGFRPVEMPNIGKSVPGSTMYQLPSGKMISRKDMEWLSRLSKATGKGNAEADAKHNKAVEDLMSDDWHSWHLTDREKKWLEKNGYRYAKGGLSRIHGDNMIPTRRGGLSMANRPSPGESRSYYRYGAPPSAPQPAGMPARPMAPTMQRAMGGLAMYGFSSGGPQNLVRGPGTGRSDDIPAVLSDGEYVMDAETVALLGDGSTDEGARRLDELRKKLRMHKGRQLSRGQFSSAAKNPEEYL